MRFIMKGPSFIFLVLVAWAQHVRGLVNRTAVLTPENTYSSTDSRADTRTIYTSIEGILITSISASISAMCSALIIYFILKSSMGISSVYHRIVGIMSLGDVLASLAMALTTLPMPTHIHNLRAVSWVRRPPALVKDSFSHLGA